MRRRLLALLFLSLVAATPTPDATQAELLRGVRAFRAGQYEEALARFVQLRPAVPDIGFYLGTTLHKLGRHAEALAAFRAARQAGLREPVSAYYEALSCYQLGLLTRSRRGFEALARPDAAAGPRLRDGAGRFLGRIDALEATAPASARYAVAVERARAAAADPVAIEWIEEAALLLPTLPDAAAQAPALRPLLARWASSLPEAGRDLEALLQRLGGGR